jgi:SAM-dependent methyltransferase
VSSQLRFLTGYTRMVDACLGALDEDRAMEAAVGGHFALYGQLEYRVLQRFGLQPGALIADLGCGSGRLASALREHARVRYLGMDVVAKLLAYANRRWGGDGFVFCLIDRPAIPLADGQADMVTSFSVFTHILPEESFVYLEEARRVLRPGGRVVLSFLDLHVPATWAVFEENLAWVRNRTMAGHLNVFLNPNDLRLWAGKLGFEIEAVVPGDEPVVTVTPEEADARLPAGQHAFGQSLAVWRKPG